MYSVTVICCQAKHATEGNNTTWGVDGDTGNLVDMKEFGIWEPYSVKAQAYKTAIEVCHGDAEHFLSDIVTELIVMLVFHHSY